MFDLWRSYDRFGKGLFLVVMRNQALSSSVYLRLPGESDSFHYYRGGSGERHGNNLFLFALAPCFSPERQSSLLPSPFNDNSHLSVRSNHSSTIVAVGPVTHKDHSCTAMYDVNELWVASFSTYQVVEKYDKFIQQCSLDCYRWLESTGLQTSFYCCVFTWMIFEQINIFYFWILNSMWVFCCSDNSYFYHLPWSYWNLVYSGVFWMSFLNLKAYQQVEA